MRFRRWLATRCKASWQARRLRTPVRPALEPLYIKAGVPHRFRFLSMTLDEETDVSIARNDSVVTWTPMAKDAMPIPAAERTHRPAKLHFGPGETYDFEFTPQAGQYHMKVLSRTNVLITIIAE